MKGGKWYAFLTDAWVLERERAVGGWGGGEGGGEERERNKLR